MEAKVSIALRHPTWGGQFPTLRPASGHAHRCKAARATAVPGFPPPEFSTLPPATTPRGPEFYPGNRRSAIAGRARWRTRSASYRPEQAEARVPRSPRRRSHVLTHSPWLRCAGPAAGREQPSSDRLKAPHGKTSGSHFLRGRKRK